MWHSAEKDMFCIKLAYRKKSWPEKLQLDARDFGRSNKSLRSKKTELPKIHTARNMKHLIKWCLSRLSSIYSCPLYVNQGSQYEVHTRTTRPPLPHLCFYFLSQLFSQFSHFLCSRDFALSLIWKGWYYSQIQKRRWSQFQVQNLQRDVCWCFTNS